MDVELRNVSKQFGQLRAVTDVSFVIPNGSRVALLGPNGSGKSTLIRAILGLIECRGEILLDGRSPFRHRSTLAARIAYVPQIAPQLGASVRELIQAIAVLRGLPPGTIEKEAKEMDLDLRPALGRPFRYLSGGMKQKLLAAIAFASRPELLVLDEPTASLDEAARARFWQMLKERAPQATVLLCSHRVDEARDFACRALVMQEGRLVRDTILQVGYSHPSVVSAANEAAPVSISVASLEGNHA